MLELFTVDSLISLITLSLLEIVLGIDNVIFVSILLGRVQPESRLKARKIWMIAGIIVRILLLMGLGWIVKNGTSELFWFQLGNKNILHSPCENVIMLAGGLFLLYKTVKEIHEKLEGEEPSAGKTNAKPASFISIIGQIVLV